MVLGAFDTERLPRWARVRQELCLAPVEDVAAAVAEELGRPEVSETIRPGMQVAVLAGSRGIDRIAEVTAAVVREVRRLGGEPFVVPAMGSHGGATAEGQREVLAQYGLTEQSLGCPIRSSMDTVLLGHVGELPVWLDHVAVTESDAIIPVNRIKPHTDFSAPVESGLMKMLTIGLGKQRGADAFHSRGFERFHRLIPETGRFILGKVHTFRSEMDGF